MPTMIRYLDHLVPRPQVRRQKPSRGKNQFGSFLVSPRPYEKFSVIRFRSLSSRAEKSVLSGWRVKPTPTSCHSSASCFVHTALKTCSHVFVRVEGLKPSYWQKEPYQGPFEVLSRTDKHFTIKINDRTSTISIDRLKPAFLLNDTDSTKKPFPVQKSNHPVVLPPRFDQNMPIPATTRSGRKVRFNPKYL
ncbi:gag-Pol polyprotein [Trichonephila clavipes]|nr:gag-Pol polyprotein [Trichonephila clavipes]